jgi:hypothetical protein
MRGSEWEVAEFLMNKRCLCFCFCEMVAFELFSLNFIYIYIYIYTCGKFLFYFIIDYYSIFFCMFLVFFSVFLNSLC